MAERLPNKERLDLALLRRGLASTRQKAQAIILSGAVLVDDAPVDKAGALVSSSSEIRLRAKPSEYVGRGGEKIAPVFDFFHIDLRDRVVLDVGASTGGFTDCMLRGGARRVYAVDVGYNQLAAVLRTDPRVVVMERTHAKDLTPEMFVEPPTFATIDLSFISVRKVLPQVCSVLVAPQELLVLVKPQFELAPQDVGKGGVVRDGALHAQACARVREEGERLGLVCRGETAAALKGLKAGNQEYFLYFSVA